MNDKKGLFEKLGILLLGAILVVVLFARPCISAEDPAKYPSRPITLIVQWAPGGTVDLTGRKLGELASKTLGQPIVVESKTGGGGVIGTAAVAKAAPDGYTFGTASYGPLVYVPHLRETPYKTKEDFTFIMQYLDMTQLFYVRAETPWKTFKEFIEAVRSNPGKMSYSSPGQLSGQHLFMEQVFAEEKVKISHVPVSGGAEAVTQILGGHIEGALCSEGAPHVKTGKLRALAVQSEKRSPDFPEVPTFLEMGYKLEAIVWTGLYGPKGIDPQLVQKVFEAFKKAYEDPSYRELCKTLVLVPTYRDSEAFRQMVFRQYDTNGVVLKQLGFVK